MADFMRVPELAKVTGFSEGSFYTWHSSGGGPLAPILTKCGGKLGAWREDYLAWRESQRKFKPDDERSVA
jgi:predicted DNA-binding transcriptional regulator AlpA